MGACSFRWSACPRLPPCRGTVTRAAVASHVSKHAPHGRRDCRVCAKCLYPSDLPCPGAPICAQKQRAPEIALRRPPCITLSAGLEADVDAGVTEAGAHDRVTGVLLGGGE